MPKNYLALGADVFADLSKYPKELKDIQEMIKLQMDVILQDDSFLAEKAKMEKKGELFTEDTILKLAWGRLRAKIEEATQDTYTPSMQLKELTIHIREAIQYTTTVPGMEPESGDVSGITRLTCGLEYLGYKYGFFVRLIRKPFYQYSRWSEHPAEVETFE